MSNVNTATIIGGGLAGTEAAYQIAKNGFKARLYEMRPKVSTAAHKTSFLGELVCSNSLKSYSTLNASGILKEEKKTTLARCLIWWDFKQGSGIQNKKEYLE